MCRLPILPFIVLGEGVLDFSRTLVFSCSFQAVRQNSSHAMLNDERSLRGRMLCQLQRFGGD